MTAPIGQAKNVKRQLTLEATINQLRTEIGRQVAQFSWSMGQF